MDIKLSVITPSYNQGQFIERTILSVLSQNIPNLEYIVMDGGSTDNTLDILKKYESQIRWFSERDNGQADAVNKGLKLASGDVICWLNSDDIYYPNALETISHYFGACPEVDVVYGHANHIDSNDQVMETYYTETWNIERLKEVCYLCQPAVFFRRNVVDRFGALNDKLQYCMDYEYWLRLANRGAHFSHISQLLSGSRLHADTKTLGSKEKVHKEINDMLKMHFKSVPDRWLMNYSHVIARSKYNEATFPLHFRRAVAIETIKAAFRWNKWINKSLLKLTLTWLASSFQESIAWK